MLFEFTREVALRLRNYPVDVGFGDERFDRTLVVDNRITVKQKGPETWGPPIVTQQGPKPALWTRNVGVSAFFEIRSDAGGAGVIEHQRECNRIVEAFMSAAFITAQRRGTPIVGQSALSPGFAELSDGPDGWSGSTYEVTFQLRAGSFLAEALATVDASTLTSQGTVGVTSGNQVQVACEPPTEEP